MTTDIRIKKICKKSKQGESKSYYAVDIYMILWKEVYEYENLQMEKIQRVLDRE